MAGNRPGGVTLVAVLAWITGVLNVISGILVLTGTVSVAGASPAAAWTSIILGIIVFLVSLGLFRGSNTARILTTISFVLNLASAIFLLVTHGAGNVTAIVAAVTSLLGLILLYTRRANEFFRS